MNGQKVSGIDETRLEKLIQRILSNVEQLEKRFQQLDMVIDESNKFYKGTSANQYRSAYNNLRYNYDIVKKNILSYVDDLNKVKFNYTNFASLSADIYQNTGVKNDISKYEGRE